MSLMLPWLLCAMAELSPSPDVQPIPVTGVVVDAAGRPLRDAEIWLTRATRVEEDRKSGRDLSWMGTYSEDEEPLDLVPSRSDAEGRFRLEVTADVTARFPILLDARCSRQPDLGVLEGPAGSIDNHPGDRYGLHVWRG